VDLSLANWVGRPNERNTSHPDRARPANPNRKGRIKHRRRSNPQDGHRLREPVPRPKRRRPRHRPERPQRRVPAYWDGNGIWRFRYSSAVTGTHKFTIDTADPQLKQTTGAIEISAYIGDNPLYKHGAIEVAGDRHHFEYADGVPFFWLGDTWWKGLAKRIPLEGFKQLAEDRKAKGFTVAQIVAGPYPDEPAFDPRWANEAGMPYEPDYRQVNPAYFDQADIRMRALIDNHIVPAIVGGWGWHMPAVGVEKFIRHWRYLIARYAAYQTPASPPASQSKE